MKIIYICDNTNVNSGWGRYSHDLISEIRKNGNEALILRNKNTTGEGIPFVLDGFNSVNSILKLRKYIKGYDIVHAIDINPFGMIAFLGLLGTKIPYVITALGTYSIAPLYNWKTKFLSKLAYKNAKQIVAMSSYTKKRLIEAGVSSDIKVVQNGLRMNEFLQQHEDSGEQFILSVGELKKRKGYHVSLRAFANLKEKFPKLRYKIVGGKSDGFISLVKELKIEDRVDFLVNISDEELKKLYKTALLFILTSVNDGNHFEGFGLVFLEAASSGLPVIGTRGNGIEDAIDKNGILVDQENIQMTQDAIFDILSDSDKWKSMSIASYDWAKKHSIEITAKKYEDIYKNIIK